MVFIREGKEDVEHTIKDISIEPIEPGDTRLYILNLVYGAEDTKLSLFLSREKLLSLAQSMEKIK